MVRRYLLEPRSRDRHSLGLMVLMTAVAQPAEHRADVCNYGCSLAIWSKSPAVSAAFRSDRRQNTQCLSVWWKMISWLCFPRDAMRKRGFCCRPVSVCPSVTLVHCNLHGWRYRQTSFSARYPHHSSFWPPAPVPNSKGNPSAGTQNTRGGWEFFFVIFEWNRRLSRKRNVIGPWLLWDVNMEVVCALSNGDIFNDLDGPLL